MRRSLVAGGVVLCALALGSSLVPASAQAIDVPQPPSGVAMREFVTPSGFNVSADAEVSDLAADSPVVCVHARKTTARGSTTTTVEEHGCDLEFEGYTFDPVTWEGSAVGSMKTVLSRTVRKSIGGTKTVEKRTSRATVRLSWIGTGETKVVPPKPPMVGICYTLWIVCFNWQSPHIYRTAAVNGTIQLEGLSLQAAIPKDQSGRVWLVAR